MAAASDRITMTDRDSSIVGESPDTTRTKQSVFTTRDSTRGGGTSRRNQPDPALSAYDVWSWGFGGRGALGNRAFRDEIAPYLVSELRGHGGTLLVTCGLDHTIAVRA